MPRSSLQKTVRGGQFQAGGEINSKMKGSWRFLLQEKKLKLAHSGESPGNVFVKKDETTDRGAYQKKRDGRIIVYQKKAKPPVLRTVGGFHP